MLTICWGSESWRFSFLLHSCLHHWLPHHTEDLGDLFHACLYFISKNKQHRGEIAKRNSMHRVSQASAQNPISCFKALTMTRRSGCQAGREPSPRGVPATHCEAKWALQGSLATSCRYGAAVWFLCFLRQAGRAGGKCELYTWSVRLTVSSRMMGSLSSCWGTTCWQTQVQRWAPPVTEFYYSEPVA